MGTGHEVIHHSYLGTISGLLYGGEVTFSHSFQSLGPLSGDGPLTARLSRLLSTHRSVSGGSRSVHCQPARLRHRRDERPART